MSQKPHKNRFFVGVGGLKRLVSFSVKEKKQPMQHGTGDLVLIQTTPARLLVNAALPGLFKLSILNSPYNKKYHDTILHRVIHIDSKLHS